jgi:AcrR family transcriptional regulator
MPKKSRVETKKTVRRILDAVADQLLRLGYDKMSYTTLSQQTGISRTGISHHFPKKRDFMSALDLRIYNTFLSYLRFDGQLSHFTKSWLNSLSNPEFVSILRVMLHHTVTTKKEQERIHKEEEIDENEVTDTLDRLLNELDKKFGKESKKELEWLIGKSLVVMSIEA